MKRLADHGSGAFLKSGSAGDNRLRFRLTHSGLPYLDGIVDSLIQKLR